MDNNKEKSTSPALKVIKTGAVLLIISTLIAGMLAVINGLTAPVIESNKEKEKSEAITAIFGSFDRTEEAERSLSAPVTAVYEVYGADRLAGYCVFVTESGFGGNLEIMVGADVSGKLIGIQLLDMSETPGVGSKISDSGYLASYIGADSSVEFGNGVDAIAGATISSKALMRGVKAALAPEVLFGSGDNNPAQTEAGTDAPVSSGISDGAMSPPETEIAGTDGENAGQAASDTKPVGENDTDTATADSNSATDSVSHNGGDSSVSGMEGME